MFMPRKHSRITLEITGVRVERVKDITEDDAKAEGVEPISSLSDVETTTGPIVHRAAFMRLWDSLYAKRGAGWDVNPFVWAIEFKRIE